jgi:maleylpyruvate isomerase
MTPDPLADLGAVRRSAEQLGHDVRLLDEQALAAPSLLPGWTRATVVGHLVGNAEGLTRLLDWAATGEPVHQYADAEARTAPIDAAAGQSADVLADRLQVVTESFVARAADLDPEQWNRRVHLGIAGQGRQVAASELPWRRLVEQEVHDVDLAGAYTPAHWPEAFVHRLLGEVAELFLVRDDVPPLLVGTLDGDWSASAGGDQGDPTRVEGPAPALLAWLIGRSDGEGLHVNPPPLPALPPWF